MERLWYLLHLAADLQEHTRTLHENVMLHTVELSDSPGQLLGRNETS